MAQDFRFNSILEPLKVASEQSSDSLTDKLFEKGNEALINVKKEPLANEDGLVRQILYNPLSETLLENISLCYGFLSELVNIATSSNKIAYSVSCSEESLTNALVNELDSVKKAIVLKTDTAGEVKVVIKKSDTWVPEDEDKIAETILDYLPVGSTDFTVGSISKEVTVSSPAPIATVQNKTIRWDYTVTRYFRAELQYVATTDKGLSLDLTNAIRSVFLSLIEPYYKDNFIGRDIYYQPFGYICDAVNEVASISIILQEYNPDDLSDIGNPFTDTNITINDNELSFISDEVVITAIGNRKKINKKGK